MEKPDLKREFGPFMRALAARYFPPVRFAAEDDAQWARLHERGFVIHVMRTTAWINYLFLAWALIVRGLPPIRAVVNLRPWFTRPWRKTAQRGEFDVRFTYARRQSGSGLIFLKRSAIGSARGKNITEDPFPALIAMARKSDRPVYLVPELFVWERIKQKIKPNIIDYIFGSPEAPGFLHTLLAFFRNFRRAQFRVGEEIDLQKFINENPGDSDAVLARKVRSALYHHLARETRAVFGPPAKTADRLIEEILRDRSLTDSLAEVAQQSGRSMESVLREAEKDLNAIAARPSPTVVGILAPLLHRIFNRIYDGIEVDESGLDRAMKVASKAPLVLCPSHKSHIDYLVLSYVLWNRGYSVPLVAAGANLAFFGVGPMLRRGGAFFLRRSFKDDKIYAASFKAYVRKLIHDGIHQEFFPEGGRSRTGKLLAPKLGMFTWQVEAVLEGAKPDVYFVPIAIDYEKVVESGSYSKELAGGEKKAESLGGLLSATKVLAYNYGRIHLSFDEPISLQDFMRSRGLQPDVPVTDEQKKALVRALGNRVMYGVSRVSTVTAHALASTALLAHRRRGITAREFTDRVVFLRQIAAEDGARMSEQLKNSPSDPTVLGALQEAMQTFIQDEMVTAQEVRGEFIYRAEDLRRAELSFYKNTLMNLVVSRSLVANALLFDLGLATVESVKQRALFLSRLFKFEFIYRTGASFDVIFHDTLEMLVRGGLITRPDEQIISVAPEAHARPHLEFLADLLRDYLESYLIAALTVNDVASGAVTDKKGFAKAALETGRVEFLAGRVSAAESLSRTTLENALQYLLDQKILVEKDKKLTVAPAFQDAKAREELVGEIRAYLKER